MPTVQECLEKAIKRPETAQGAVLGGFGGGMAGLFVSILGVSPNNPLLPVAVGFSAGFLGLPTAAAIETTRNCLEGR